MGRQHTHVHVGEGSQHEIDQLHLAVLYLQWRDNQWGASVDGTAAQARVQRGMRWSAGEVLHERQPKQQRLTGAPHVPDVGQWQWHEVATWWNNATAIQWYSAGHETSASSSDGRMFNSL